MYLTMKFVPMSGTYISAQKTPTGIQSGHLSQGQVPLLNATALKVQKTRDNFKAVVNKNLQATLYCVQ